MQTVGVVVVKVGIRVGILDGGIVDVGASPHVILYEEIDAAELAARSHALVYGIRGSTRGRVGVHVKEVAHLNIDPPRHGVDEAPRVVIGSHDAVDSPSGVRHATFGVLPPAFVPDNPCTDTRMVTGGIDDGFVLAVEVLHSVLESAYRSAAAARRHVLPNDQAVTVAPLEPKVVLYLDVLAHHVHAEVLDGLKVEDHRFV